MREYAELRVEFIFDPKRQGSGFSLLKFYFTPFDGEEGRYECKPATVPTALTKLAAEGWELVTSVGFPFMGTGGDWREMTTVKPPQLIHTLARDVPDVSDGPSEQ